MVAIFGVAASCGPSTTTGNNTDGGTVGGTCTPGQTSCSGQQVLNCVNGAFVAGMTCANVCDPTLGCVLCNPGTGTCNGNVSHACNADGMGYSDVTCDATEGVTCGASGTCEGACAPANLGSSYIGCEYYPTVTGNVIINEFDFAISLANAASTAATVTIENGALTAPTTVMVPANSVVLEKLPWQTDLKMCNGPGEANNGTQDTEEGCATTAAQVTKGAYHVRSTLPITVYQFNSLDYQLGNDFSYTNDASLMLPTNVWNSTYYAASYTSEGAENSTELAVTASVDNTTVMINAKASTAASGGAPAFTAGTPKSVMLNAGDVIEISSGSGDLTGSLITADQPIQVIAGHSCANVPVGTPACDHLEESMFSVDALGQNYFVNAPTIGSAGLVGKTEVVRIIATAAGTNLTYTPAQSGAPATIANAGDYVTVTNNASFMIHADQKVMVAQYMEGQGSDPQGDPAMTLAVPVEQFRSSYLFHAPISYSSNYIDITAPVGASIMLDGTQIMFTAVGTTGFALARKLLTAGPASDGNHSIMGDMPFGIQVYGYGQYTSYWYPGGLNLMSIVISDTHPTTSHAAAPIMLAPGY